ncbi:hypothetical protein WR25_13861 [Diploscapter pachys]|uniref:Polyadenylate-binding protein n=1 Tax=Diploscapter pachys TaxID=2018661 RepID=A0A2A2KXW6_9BILA|nr:hypothetical protein WR25_13861 [Diploscapter pachys]
MNDNETSLECCICSEIYNSVERVPVIGSCNHTVCLQCATILKTNSRRCPVCNAPFAFQNFNKNFGMINAIETLEAKEHQLLEAQCERERLQQEGAQAAERLQQYERERNRSEQEKAEAGRAIEESARKMKEYEENMKKLKTEFDRLTTEKQASKKVPNPKGLFVTPLLSNVDEDYLKYLFKDYGELESVVKKTPAGKPNEGYAFLKFKEERSATRAKEAITEILGQKVKMTHLFESVQNPAASATAVRSLSSGPTNTTPQETNILNTIRIQPVNHLLTEDVLRQSFARFGRIENITIPKNLQSNTPIGYATITFKFADEARLAQQTTDRQIVLGHCISVELRANMPDLNIPNNSKAVNYKGLYVSPLKDPVDDAYLKFIFGKFGEIESVVKKDQIKKGKIDQGFAFIKFKEESGAKRAKETINETMILDLKVYIKYLEEKSQSHAPPRPVSPSNSVISNSGSNGPLDTVEDLFALHLTNLPSNWDESNLEYISQGYGRLVEKKMYPNPRNNPFLIGYVRFEEQESARKACDGLNGKQLFEDYNWNNLRVDPVTNIVDEDVLWQAFNKFGIIESIKITEDSIRKNETGYANVIFSRKEDAYRAKLEMNNKLVTFCKAICDKHSFSYLEQLFE